MLCLFVVELLSGIAMVKNKRKSSREKEKSSVTPMKQCAYVFRGEQRRGR